MNDQDALQTRASKAEILERIRRAYAALQETLRSLTPEQLVHRGASGWAVKDHLAHLAVWELGIVALLERRPRFAAMHVQEAVEQGQSEDEINDLIYRRHAGLSHDEALAMFQEAHAQIVQTIEALSDDNLNQPYAAYLPEGSEGSQQPVWHWIAGNTFGHYDEHNGYIRELLALDKDGRQQGA